MINYSIAMLGNPAKKQDPKKAYGVAQYTEKMTSFAITILLNTWIIRFFFYICSVFILKPKIMKKNKKRSWNIPWGWITFINVVIGMIACSKYFTSDSATASVWADITIYSMLALCITMPIWFVRLIHRLCKKLDGPSGPTPWWYGGL